MLIEFEIEDGPTKEELKESCATGKKVYFKVEGKDRPAIIIEMDDLPVKEGLYYNVMGFTLTGRFVAAYDFLKKKGCLLTKYGTIIDNL